MGLTRSEQETVIRWDEDEQTVHIWSAAPKTWRRLAKLGLEPLRETRTEGKPSGRFYRLPLARFRWGLRQKARNPDGRGVEALQKARDAHRARNESVNSPHGRLDRP